MTKLVGEISSAGGKSGQPKSKDYVPKPTVAKPTKLAVLVGRTLDAAKPYVLQEDKKAVIPALQPKVLYQDDSPIIPPLGQKMPYQNDGIGDGVAIGEGTWEPVNAGINPNLSAVRNTRTGEVVTTDRISGDKNTVLGVRLPPIFGFNADDKQGNGEAPAIPLTDFDIASGFSDFKKTGLDYSEKFSTSGSDTYSGGRRILGVTKTEDSGKSNVLVLVILYFVFAKFF